MSARSGEGAGLRDSTPAEPGTRNACFRTGRMGRCLSVFIDCVVLFSGSFQCGSVLSLHLNFKKSTINDLGKKIGE